MNGRGPDRQRRATPDRSHTLKTGVSFAEFLDLQRRRIRKRLLRAEVRAEEDAIEAANDGMRRYNIVYEGDFEYRR